MHDGWIDSDSIGDPQYFSSLDRLEHGLAAMPAAPKDEGTVALIVRRLEMGRRELLDHVEITSDGGVSGDSWGRLPDRDFDGQIAVMQAGVAELIANGQPLALFGDSLFLDIDLSADNLPAASHVRIGRAVLTVTPLAHNGCQKFRARFGHDALRFVSKPDLRHRNLRGIFVRVVEGGTVRVGDAVQLIARGGTA